MARLQDGRYGVLIPKGERYVSSRKCPAPLFNEHRMKSGAGVRPTTDLHVVPRASYAPSLYAVTALYMDDFTLQTTGLESQHSALSYYGRSHQTDHTTYKLKTHVCTHRLLA